MSKIKDKPNPDQINSPLATQSMFDQVRSMLAQSKDENGKLKYSQARIKEIIGGTPAGRSRLQIANTLLEGL